MLFPLYFEAAQESNMKGWQEVRTVFCIHKHEIHQDVNRGVPKEGRGGNVPWAPL